MASLRASIFIDQLQPQTLCYLGSWIRGTLPRAGMAAQVIEVAPGLDIEALTDVALKDAEVQAGILVVERQFGYLEFHARSTAAVRSAADAVVSRRSGPRPDRGCSRRCWRRGSSPASTRSTPFSINRNRLGSMALAGETLHVLEMEPAAYAFLAANEAEKAAEMKLVDFRMIGATGRLYLSGTEASVEAAASAAQAALEAAA